MNRRRGALRLGVIVLLILLARPLPLAAQSVPQLINYQGRVAVGGVNFSGSGLFKFALVNADGSQTYWSNDGSSANGSQPVAAVAITVANGLYSVLLGDSSIPNMNAVPATVFTNPDVRLRVWFSDGINGSQLLTPDQRIAAVGYALMADGVKAGGVTSFMIANGAVGSMQIAAGAVGNTQLAVGAAAANITPGSLSSTQLAPGAAAANLGASGGVIFSPVDNNPGLLAVGYVKVGATTLADNWQQRSSAAPTGAPAGRYFHTAVWTGSEMIVWGGQGGGFLELGDGARYSPASNVWTALPSVGAPTARAEHTAVWTGAEMIIWGGLGSAVLNDGARYKAATNSWAALPATGAPAARQLHSAVWTGFEMLVFGGYINSIHFNDLSSYAPGRIMIIYQRP